MAINFPPNASNPNPPSDGEQYTDPNSGTWVYDLGTNSWTLVAGGTTSAFNFRGGHDFRQSTPPAAPIESGDMWIHDAPEGTIDAVYTGLSGQIGNGQLVLWDGNSYVKVSGEVPGYPNIDDGEGANLDSRYLKLGPNAQAQTVATTNPTTFNGQISSGQGIEVTGGGLGNIANGIYKSGSNVDISNNGSAMIQTYNSGTTKVVSFGAPQASNIGFNVLASPNVYEPSGQASQNGAQFKTDIQDTAKAVTNITSIGDYDATSIIENLRLYAAALSRQIPASGASFAKQYGYYVGSDANTNLYAAQNNYGYYSKIVASSIGKNNYNFYQEGSAPNYFAGPVTGGGTGTSPNWHINPDGSTSPFNIQLQMESDDPTAYQTTYSTDDEGNQIENTTYIGEAESLLAIIKDLRARVAALEAG